ncbi:MAG TPA: hypothetical protein VGO41_08185 [Steroidobacteraceae bacterium]|nr:hypothetical protein [Steroidobacteraceae bacterium]
MPRTNDFRPLLAGLLLLVAAGASTAAGAAGEAACNRACLDGIASQFLQSVVTHDPSRLKLAPGLRYTEDSLDLKPGQGFWSTAGRLRQHRLNLLDEKRSTAAGLAVMEEGGQPVLLAYRLKVDKGAVSEIETLVVKRTGERAMLDMTTLAVPRQEFLVKIPPAQRASRDELLRISQFYPDGLKVGSFVKVDAPFAANARRLENGMVLAGPDCSRNENCKNMKTQPSPERPTLRQRLLAVDEEQGITFYWIAWEQQTGNTLIVWEAFKVYGGQIQGVEAFLERGDPKLNSGWK